MGLPDQQRSPGSKGWEVSPPQYYTDIPPLLNIFTAFNKLGLPFPGGYYPIVTHSQAWLSRTQQVQAHLPVSGQGHNVLEM